ncbi:restriction endonuclease subunit S [Pseudomonas syringae]|uniref:restriction endonuclease subunit S n=1 Tax=Pseudomonas syringae TaxID=317 RepID=UPI0023F832D1|nr:restriction endonuclease subunit S [Pseudomonas syringae]MDF5832810.1 restriction endonuclease subunit S [Pseudomonas syringae]
MTDHESAKPLSAYISVKHGFAFEGRYFCDEPTVHVLVTPGNFAIGGGFQEGKAKYYAGPIPQDYVLHGGELVVTMTDLSKAGDTLGYPALIPTTIDRVYLHNQRVGLVSILLPDQLDRDYLYYLLRTEAYRNHILATASGSTVRHTSPTRICDYIVELPPLRDQKAIAKTLRALDDKVDQNRRTSRMLEELARTTFKAWFVDFEPVRAKATGQTSFPGMPSPAFAALPNSLTDSLHGMVPQGWTVQALADVFDINPPRRLSKGDEAPYLDMKNMPTTGHAPDAWERRPHGSGMRFINGDTLVARITPCLENGKTAYVDFLNEGEVGWGSTEYIVLRPKPPLPEIYAYCLARTQEFRDFAIQNMTGTSGRQRVAASALNHFHIAAPDSVTAAAFGDVVLPLFKCIHAGKVESAKLVMLREYLLPRLMTGALRVISETAA